MKIAFLKRFWKKPPRTRYDEVRSPTGPVAPRWLTDQVWKCGDCGYNQSYWRTTCTHCFRMRSDCLER
jgi:hypothetical protein